MRFREMVQYTVIGALCFLIVQQHCELRRMEHSDAVEVVAPPHLPSDVLSAGRLAGRVLETVTRRDDGTGVTSRSYIPPESDIEHIVRVDTLALQELEAVLEELEALRSGDTLQGDSARIDSLAREVIRIEHNLATAEIIYKSHGFCWRPEMGIGIDTDLKPVAEVGARIYFFGRMGIGINAMGQIPTEDSREWKVALGIFGDCRIPGWENSAVFASLGYDFNGGKTRAAVGVQVYFK